MSHRGITLPLPLSMSTSMLATRLYVYVAATPVDAVHVFGRKRHAIAVAHCERGHGLFRVNGIVCVCLC